VWDRAVRLIGSVQRINAFLVHLEPLARAACRRYVEGLTPAMAEPQLARRTKRPVGAARAAVRQCDVDQRGAKGRRTRSAILPCQPNPDVRRAFALAQLVGR